MYAVETSRRQVYDKAGMRVWTRRSLHRDRDQISAFCVDVERAVVLTKDLLDEKKNQPSTVVNAQHVL